MRVRVVMALVLAAMPGLAAGQASGLEEGAVMSFRAAVRACWTVDAEAPAGKVAVTVAFRLNRSGTVVPGSLRLVAATEGSDAAVENAYAAARRAILRCQGSGYRLPLAAYDAWREVEITFDPGPQRIS